MQEVVFLKKNASYWKRVESLLEVKSKFNPDELTDLYIRLTDDLAYSKTFYPQSKTADYLNSVTTRIHQKIYKNKKEKVGRVKIFWLKELPYLFYKHQFKLLSSFIIFSIAVLIGVVSAANDDGFVRTILGDSYVNMTLENIKNDDPMAVYKKMNEVEMFLGITFNNIRVSFMAFISGLLFSFGTGLVLLQNGIMLGSFQYFFFEHGINFSCMGAWNPGNFGHRNCRWGWPGYGQFNFISGYV